ncbi:helix-turn-helix transcriptional regulator [Stenotrophomonas sp. 278]|uniref:helix-turn-helix transcriptional regulator n=1 Tax=Stenotrophomonas sp. 278 TaxID=2479851 RepID=UPI000F674025|nr:helix-turn-helix transcriptional regulator [Stenotrophomonas sp. 278]RRU16041.1 transcriptional regulator [Stenotrophomonas sp. 278]
MDLVREVEDIGKMVRTSRKRHALTQADLAGLSGTGIRFISDLEHGKPTLEFGKVLTVLKVLGVGMTLQDRAT